MEETGGVIRRGNHQPFAILSFSFSPTFSLSLLPSLYLPLASSGMAFLARCFANCDSVAAFVSDIFLHEEEREWGIFASFFSRPSPPISPFVSAEAREIGDIFRATANTREIKVAPPLSLLYTRTSIYLSLPFENAAFANGNVAVSPPFSLLVAEIYDEGC